MRRLIEPTLQGCAGIHDEINEITVFTSGNYILMLPAQMPHFYIACLGFMEESDYIL